MQWEMQLPALRRLIEALTAPKKGLFDMADDPKRIEKDKSGMYRKVAK